MLAVNMQHPTHFVSAIGITLGAAGIRSLPDLNIWLSMAASVITIVSGTIAIVFAVAAFFTKKK